MAGTFMQFYALLEEWSGESTVFFRALPGCFVTAATSEEALAKAPAVVEQYFSWLKENRIVLVEEEIIPIEVVLTERLASAGNAGPLFLADLPAPDDLEIDAALNVAATARAEIIEMVADVPEHLHDMLPATGGWSLREHLQHIMECELFYVSRLSEQPVSETSGVTFTMDEIAMKIFEHAMDSEIFLRDLPTELRTQV